MKELENWIKDNDGNIIELVRKVAKPHNVSSELKGYWIEDNNLIGNGYPIPVYDSLKDFRNLNPYMEITYVRYFFELKNSRVKVVLTVSFARNKENVVQFSIDELGKDLIFNQFNLFQEEGYKILEDFLIKKFRGDE